MELLQLHYFMKVAELNNVSQAAKELNIVQSALSRSIGRLEEDLGVLLFDRIGKKIVLNDNGRIAYEKCSDILKGVEDLYGQFETAKKKGIEIKLKIETASALLPDLIIQFGKDYPEVEFVLMQQGDKGDYDIRLYSIPGKLDRTYEQERNGVHVVLEEEIKILIPREYLDNDCSTIDIGQLKHIPFIGLAKGIGLRDMIDKLMSKWKIKLNYVFETDNPSMMRQMLPQGRGALFFPTVTWKSYDQNIYCLATLGKERYWRTIVAECKNNKKINNEFIKYLTKKIQDLKLAKN